MGIFAISFILIIATQAYPIPEEEGGWAGNKYRDYWGYEVDLLVTISDILNFDYTIRNPEDGKWGHVETDGTWSGIVGDAAKGIFDFVICDVFIIYSRQQGLRTLFSDVMRFKAFT